MSETQTEVQFGRTVIVRVSSEHDVAMGNVTEGWKTMAEVADVSCFAVRRDSPSS